MNSKKQFSIFKKQKQKKLFGLVNEKSFIEKVR